MTQQLRDLMAAIRAKPDDDTPRQVLADFYEEQGRATRADFVRAQLLRASVSRLDPGWLELELAQRALHGHGDAWRRELPSIEGVRWGSFRRGLVGSVAFDDVALVPQHIEAVMRTANVSSLSRFITWG